MVYVFMGIGIVLAFYGIMGFNQQNRQLEELIEINMETNRLITLIIKKEEKMSFNKSVPQKYFNVLYLHKEGLGVNEIARRLDLGVRETRLIMKIYDSKEVKRC
jgi:DNA-binding NarL/FixJ family response regulator